MTSTPCCERMWLVKCKDWQKHGLSCRECASCGTHHQPQPVVEATKAPEKPKEVCGVVEQKETNTAMDEEPIYDPCLYSKPCPVHPTPTTTWEKEFDRLTDVEHLIHDDVPREELEQSLYGVDEYPETQYELDRSKVKAFISQALEQTKRDKDADAFELMMAAKRSELEWAIESCGRIVSEQGHIFEATTIQTLKARLKALTKK